MRNDNQWPWSFPTTLIDRHAWLSLLCCLIIWSVLPGNLCSGQTSHEFPIFGLQFSPDGKLLAAASNAEDPPGPIVIWNTDDWSLRQVHRPGKGNRHVDFSPDGSLLAYGTIAGGVGILDVASGTVRREIDAHSHAVYSVVFTPDGASLVSSGADRSIKLWNVDTGELMRRFDGHSDTVCGVAVSPDGQTLLSGSIDEQARLWNMQTGQVMLTFEPNDLIVRRVSFSRDGDYFTTSRWDGRVRIREAKTGQLRALLVGGSDCSDLTADNKLVVTSGNGSVAYVFAINLDEPSNDDQQRIERLIREFDRDSYQAREAAAKELLQIGMIAEGQLREAMDSEDAEIRVRARRLRQKAMSPDPIAKLPGHAGDVEVVCFSPDGKLMATGCRGGDVKVWNVSTFNEVVTLRMGATPQAQ